MQINQFNGLKVTRGMFLVLLVFCVGKSASAHPSRSSQVTEGGYEYNPGTPITDGPNPDPGDISPNVYDNTPIQVSPGDPMIFDINARDNDKYRLLSTPPGPWSSFRGSGPYTITLSVSSGANFQTPNTGPQSVPYNDSLIADNINLYINSSWSGTSNITVTATIHDNAPNPIEAPYTGTNQDPDKVNTWIITKRTKLPTNIKWVGGTPQGTWVTSPATYLYQVGPDAAPTYQNQSILETFGVPTANGMFSMSDLTAAWKEAHPMVSTPDQAAAIIFSSGQNASGVTDSQDEISDTNTGTGTFYGDMSMFTSDALNSGIGWQVTQSIVAGGNTLGTYVIYSKYIQNIQYPAGLLTINKTGP